MANYTTTGLGRALPTYIGGRAPAPRTAWALCAPQFAPLAAGKRPRGAVGSLLRRQNLDPFAVAARPGGTGPRIGAKGEPGS